MILTSENVPLIDYVIDNGYRFYEWNYFFNNGYGVIISTYIYDNAESQRRYNYAFNILIGDKSQYFKDEEFLKTLGIEISGEDATDEQIDCAMDNFLLKVQELKNHSEHIQDKKEITTNDVGIEISTRLYNCLRAFKIPTKDRYNFNIYDLRNINIEEFKRVRTVGECSLNELNKVLSKIDEFLKSNYK